MKRTRNDIPRRPVRGIPSRSSVIALLTDFGTSDHFVGVVRGVILSINPSATIVDITHEVQPRQIRQAGYLLWAAYKYFPAGTVFLSVVDPGVGTRRRILAIRTAKYTFLAPDNKLLDFVLSEEKVIESVEVKTQNSPYILSPMSQTFHARDIFAPIAAYIANGVALKEIGKRITLRPSKQELVESENKKTAEVLHIDRFGNVITNIRMFLAPSARLKSLVMNKKRVSVWSKNYTAASEQTPSLIAGSSGLVEIIVKNGSAERLLRAHVGDRMTIQWK